MKRLALTCCIGALAIASANAQEFSRFSFDIGTGFTTPAGNASNFLNEGWNVRGGAGVNLSPHVGAMLNVGFEDMGIGGVTLVEAGATGGTVHVFHATVDPVVHLSPNGHVEFYVTGGGGVFHRYQDFNGSAVSTSNAYNQFFGLYGASSVPNPYSVVKPGFDVGAGLAVRAFGHTKVFLEAKWNHMFLNEGHTDFLPVTVGLRW
jgi:hypothetical protein